MLLVKLWGMPGADMGLEMCAALLLLGARLECGWGTQTPARPGPWGSHAAPAKAPRMGVPTPPETVWGRLGLQAMPTSSSTEHSTTLLRGPPSPGTMSEGTSKEPNSLILPRSLFGSDFDDSTTNETLVCAQTIVCLFILRQFSVRFCFLCGVSACEHQSGWETRTMGDQQTYREWQLP